MKMKLISGSNQLSLIRDTEEVTKFLEFAARKSMMNEHAVNCRLTACHNVFSVVNEEEDNVDIMLSNLDVFIHRLKNKNVEVKPSTLKVYKSRVKSSLEDYKSWSKDPFAWEREITNKSKGAQSEKREGIKQRRRSETKKEVIVQSENLNIEEKLESSSHVPENHHKVRKITLPVRPDCNVEVVLPVAGITQKEFRRLGMFLFPYCNDLDDKQTVWPVSGAGTDAE